MVFGKSVPDISLNAVANLGYAEGKFLKPVFAGDTLNASSIVIGLKENSNKKTGVVYVKTTGFNQHGEVVLDYIRWVMVNKRDENAVIPTHLPELKQALTVEDLGNAFPLQGYDRTLSGSPYLFNDYIVSEKIDHVDGVTVEESDHMMATRLYQNTAKVHFNAQTQSETRFKKRLIYGGHVISLARSLSFNGLANAHQILGLNAGKHINPLFAGDTVYAWSEVLEIAKLSDKIGALRVRTIATKNHACADFPSDTDENAILSLDYWVAMPL
jgi:2-methylfumaryl-CoA hydratase